MAGYRPPITILQYVYSYRCLMQNKGTYVVIDLTSTLPRTGPKTPKIIRTSLIGRTVDNTVTNCSDTLSKWSCSNVELVITRGGNKNGITDRVLMIYLNRCDLCSFPLDAYNRRWLRRVEHIYGLYVGIVYECCQ